MDKDAIGFPISSDLSYGEIRELAGSGTAQDVENLLRTSGGKICEGRETGWFGSGIPLHEKCLDAILDGIKRDGDDARRAAKRSLVVDYNSSSGVFSKNKGTIDADTAKEFRKNIVDLTKQVASLKKTVKKLSDSIPGYV